MTESGDYPRVLFITPCAFNRSTGGGITFGNLFAGWPKDRLATAHSDTFPVTNDVCDRFFRLGEGEIRRWIPGKFGRSGALARSPQSNPRSAGAGWVFRAAKIAKNLVFGNGLPERGVLTPELKSWIDDFRPDLIYTILGSNGILELVRKAKEHTQAPLVIHIMDDWPSSIYRGGLLSGIQRRTMRRLLHELMRDATLRIAICDEMARRYETRFGAPFMSFQNTIDVHRWGKFGKSNVAIGETFRMLYVGSILEFAQLESLADCCRAVAELRREGKSIRLDIHSPDAHSAEIRSKLEIDSSIAMHGTITDDAQFFDTLSKADLLLLPVNFDRRSIRHIRYSMPTKVPAYLVSGTPILVYGPASVAQVNYAVQAGWGEVVPEPGVENLKMAIMSLWQDHDKRLQLSQSARQVARENHDSSIVRTGFQNALRQSANQTALAG